MNKWTDGEKYETNRKLKNINISIKIIALNLNGINVPFKRENVILNKKATYNYILLSRNLS